MNKKILSLALTAVSAALLAMPAASSGQEIHFEGATSFTGSGLTSSFVASGEPTITCEFTDVTNGLIAAGGTTGTLTLDFTGCHANVLGFTVKCRTTGSEKDNTIASGGTIHFITWKNIPGAVFPAVLLTPNTTEVSCAGISNTHIEGNGIIGTITSPACGGSSATMNWRFSATGSTQDHILYTNVPYDLKARTSGGSQLTEGLNAELTLTANKAGKLNCT